MKSLSRTLVLFIAIAGSLGAQRPPVADIVPDKQALAGQARMAVAIDVVSIPGNTFRADVENRLRQGGVTILPSADQAPTYPLVRLTVKGTIVNRLQPAELNYHVALDFIQLFSLGNGKSVKGVTWSRTRSGLVPWNGIVSSSQVEAAVWRDAGSMLDDFMDDWRDVNAGPSQSRSGAPASHLFDGTWRGTYVCAGGFGGGGNTTWEIREVRPGKVEIEEQWVRFISGRNTYQGTIMGKELKATTEDLGGYEVDLTLSPDNVTLSGKYNGHPNQCRTISLRRSP